MGEMKLTKSRELWPDLVKVIACCLVVLGHFTQSMVKSGFVNDGVLYEWFQITIYSFHVPLFFYLLRLSLSEILACEFCQCLVV